TAFLSLATGSSTTKRYLHLGQSTFLPIRLPSLIGTKASQLGHCCLKLALIAMDMASGTGPCGRVGMERHCGCKQSSPIINDRGAWLQRAKRERPAVFAAVRHFPLAARGRGGYHAGTSPTEQCRPLFSPLPAGERGEKPNAEFVQCSSST